MQPRLKLFQSNVLIISKSFTKALYSMDSEMVFDKIHRSKFSVYLNFDSVSGIAMHHHLSSFNIKYTAH